MKWKQIRIKTITEAEDIIISALYDIGLEGAQIEDKIPLTAQDKEQMYIDIMPEIEEDDGIAYLNFFIEIEEGKDDEINMEEVIAQIEAELLDIRQFMDIGEGSITLSETEDKDWINNWKEYFHQFYIDELLVLPSWEEVKLEDQDKKILRIDPGTAFGTGMHETTQLCIRQLKKFVTEQTEILDIGCGSGILGILALLFGAKHAVGTDLDPSAIEATKENMVMNHIKSEHFRVMIGNIITEEMVQNAVGYEKYDIVVANILADVLVLLTPILISHMKKGGIYIMSGILDSKEELVIESAKQAGLTIVETTYQGEWVSITARKF